MSVRFPSVEFFQELKQQVANHPASMEAVAPSEAYCGFAIGDKLYVLEFDGRDCAAVAGGGNTLDLDFFLTGPPETWREAIQSIRDSQGADGEHTLEALVERGRIELCSEAPDGLDLGRDTLGFLQAFLDQAAHVDVQFD
ncbi:MAG: hypothetical protein MJE66_03045 [Proteobacteria bacterium]|nr:hypothetical protein [Pseudomonadota bacterium]